MRETRWILPGLAALAFGLRSYGIDWGLPQVYEEAYPLRIAWNMWGWGESASFDLNPHFFNYPTLYTYVQLLGQGLLFVLQSATGTVSSTLEFRAQYELEPTAFFVVGRVISTLFAVATVLVTYRIARHVAGPGAGCLAAFLVAVNHVHIYHSQMVGVDVPLTLFVMLTLWYALQIFENPRIRNYVLAGLFAGLATSTKYSGMFLPLAVLTAHVLAHWGKLSSGSSLVRALVSRRLWSAAVVMIIAFFATSPFILLDPAEFWTGFNYERTHMLSGHFGIQDTNPIIFYAKTLTSDLLGWPLVVVSCLSVFYFALVRRRAWAWVLMVFPLVYTIILVSFSMRAERYLLPVLPIACVFAGAFVAELVARRPELSVPARGAISAVALLALAAPSFASYASTYSRSGDDARTLALEWFESTVPPGSYVVMEHRGPDIFSPVRLENMEEDLRQYVLESSAQRKLYAVLQLPMFQVRSQVASGYYDLDLYEDFVDYIVTSSTVRYRYTQQPDIFPRQVRFYTELDERYSLVREFRSDTEHGPTLQVYRHPAREAEFARRQDLPSPLQLPRIDPGGVPQNAARQYHRMAVNYDAYGFHDQAADAYLIAAGYEGIGESAIQNYAKGAVRSYLRGNRYDDAMRVIEAGISESKDPAAQIYWRDLQKKLQDY